MQDRRTGKTSDKLTLFDRLAVGLLSGVVAFITFCLLWLVISGIPYGGMGLFLPFAFVWVPSLLFALLGFLTLENLLLQLFSRIWYLLYVAFGGDPHDRNYQ